MADVYLDVNYRVNLTDKEMRLIGLGLAQKLSRGEDQKEAEQLNLKLLRLQQIRINELISRIGGAISKIEETTEEPINE